jgi:hypothetical protein
MRKIKDERRYSPENDGACVYFVSEDVSHFVKVGHTTNLRRRMQHYNYTIPGETRIEGAVYVTTKTLACSVESMILKFLRGKGLAVETNKRRSEWFKLADADIREAVAHASAHYGECITRTTGLAAPRAEWAPHLSRHRRTDAHNEIRWK